MEAMAAAAPGRAPARDMAWVPGGTFLIQDRTPDDVTQPGSVSHPRGFLFEVFPRLLEVENGRRRSAATVTAELESAGLGAVTTTRRPRSVQARTAAASSSGASAKWGTVPKPT